MVSDTPTGAPVATPSRTKIAFSRPTEPVAPLQSAAPVEVAKSVEVAKAPEIVVKRALIALDQPLGLGGPEPAPPDIVEGPEDDIPNTASRDLLKGSRFK